MGFLMNLITTPKDKCLALCKEVPDFTISQAFWSDDIVHPQGILIDNEHQKVMFASLFRNLTDNELREIAQAEIKQKKPDISWIKLQIEIPVVMGEIVKQTKGKADISVYSYRDIMKAEVIEAGNAITSTNRMSQLAGAAIGTAITGGIGTIIGGLSGSKKTVSTSTKVGINVVVNDTQRPLYQIDFLKSETKKTSSKYKEAMEQAQNLHALISVLIKQADTEDAKTIATNQTATLSLADELKKISELLNQGILNQDEYNELKAKLIAKA